jgi:hypothetical protein
MLSDNHFTNHGILLLFPVYNDHDRYWLVINQKFNEILLTKPKVK